MIIWGRQVGGFIAPYRSSTLFGDFISLNSQNLLKQAPIYPRRCLLSLTCLDKKKNIHDLWMFFFLCGQGESDTRPQFGKLLFYH